MRRLIPAYVEKPAWAVYDAYMNLDATDPADLEALGDAVVDLRNALERGDALTYAPHYVLVQRGLVSWEQPEPVYSEGKSDG